MNIDDVDVFILCHKLSGIHMYEDMLRLYQTFSNG